MTACGDEDAGIAAFRHDFAGRRTLHSYAAEPAVERRAGDRMSERVFGFRTESPRTPYICIWRDPVLHRPGAEPARPSQILMACSFGTAPWTPPSSLVEEASERMRRDEATMRVKWVGEGGGYRMTEFQIEIRDAESLTAFRSAHGAAEIPALNFAKAEIVFPASSGDPLGFRISASVPARQNPGDSAREPTVSLTAEGTALPIPLWLLY